MKTITITLVVMSLALGALFPAYALNPPVQVFSPSDFPSGIFVRPPYAWDADIAVYGPWVYAVCAASKQVLQFTRDTATAKLTYVGASSFDNTGALGNICLGSFFVRPLAGGGATLNLEWSGDPCQSVRWFKFP